MSEPTQARYSYSRDEETYFGDFATEAEAIAEAEAEVGVGSHFWVGEQESPRSPEQFWSPDEWLESVACQDEYSCEWAEDWDESTREQRQELEGRVRNVMRLWLERHNLLPKFWNITKPRKFWVAGKIGNVFETVSLS